MHPAILVERLGKHFVRFHSNKPTTFMEAVLSGLHHAKPMNKFWALRGVSFEVDAGEMLGIIGHNGAGKSTLLQILGQVAYPTEGRLKMQGRIGALLDLGAGFHGDLTGRENVFVTAVVAGLKQKEVARRFDKIVEFSELEAFIDDPVRTYSSGMMMRLAFSVAVHTDPDILLVDEFLSVGDLSFQTKCLNRINEMRDQGSAIVLVSHDVNQVEQLCDRALWLKQGVAVAYGEPSVVVGQYTAEMRSQIQQRMLTGPSQSLDSGSELRINKNRFGSLEAEIANVRLLPTASLQSGNALYIEIDYVTHSVKNAIFSISISNTLGEIYLDANTENFFGPHITLQRQGTVKLRIDRLDLCAGQYFVDIGIYEQDWSYAYDYHWQAYPLIIETEAVSKGIVCPPLHWELSRNEALHTLSGQK